MVAPGIRAQPPADRLPLVLLLAVLTLVNPARAAPIHVPGDAATIQGGIDLAAPGDTVAVASGTYHENLWMHGDIVLLGERGAQVTIVDGQMTAPSIRCENVVDFQVCDLTLRRGANSAFPGGAGVSMLNAGGVLAWEALERRLRAGAGNISLDAEFCDATVRDYTRRSSSPCAPANSPAGCGLSGAHDVGCGPVAVAPASWGGSRRVSGGSESPGCPCSLV